MYNYYERSIACSICGSPGSTKQTCPLNSDSKNPDINRHFLLNAYVKQVHKSTSPGKL